MLKFFVFLLACVCIPFVVSWGGLILGPGEWLVLNIVHCENPEQYDIVCEFSRKKINRTHDCFDITMELEGEFNFSYAIIIDIFQKVDGGFKYFQTMENENLCKFVMHHAEDNVRRALSMGNIDPPDCPFGPAPLIIRNFVMDYSELPNSGVYGTFEAYVYATLEGRKEGCVKIILSFDKRNDDDNDFDLL